MTTPQGGAFGRALAHVLADALGKVILGALPPHHAERVRQHVALAEHVATELHPKIVNIGQHLLDVGTIHPLLEPIIKAWAGRE